MNKKTGSKSLRNTSASKNCPDVVHVAVAIIVNTLGDILIARRPQGSHLEGLWEFPGGKVEAGETVELALKREISEEIGIDISSARPLIKIHHTYPEKNVLLDTWLVERWHGTASGCEGQEIHWVQPRRWSDFEFPEANKAILKSISLPSVYQISSEPADDRQCFLNKVEKSLESGVKLFQLRAKKSKRSEIAEIAPSLNRLCIKHQARWLINGEPKDVHEFGAHGVHFSSQRLMTLSERPLDWTFLIGASCHNFEELKKAVAIDVDFAVLSPVRKTRTHPGAAPLGWEVFQTLINKINLPVYALGGMNHDDRVTAWKRGGQGIAMLSGLL